MYNPAKPYKKQILKLIQKTWDTPYLSIKRGIYPLFNKRFDCFEVDHTDGIGTKGIYHWRKRTFRNAVLDVLAMNLNDLALMRATPYKLQSHIIIPRDDQKAILEIVGALTDECQKRKITITGGETSIHDNIQGMDISMTVSGFIKNQKQNKFKTGDSLIGIRSSGLHSNGFTKIRKIFREKYQPEFIKPTTIYSDAFLELNNLYDIHGIMHITGGAFTKLADLLDGNDIYVNRNHKLKPQNIFKELYRRGMSDKDMYKTFNCGIGFVFSTSPHVASKIVDESLDMDIIGGVAAGIGKVRVESLFSNKLLVL